jgi:hypothetical protein
MLLVQTRLVTAVMLIGVLSVMGSSVYSDSKRLDAMRNANGRLQGLLRESEWRLRRAVASLFERAARVLAGAEQSQRIPVKHPEADRPSTRPLASDKVVHGSPFASVAVPEESAIFSLEAAL